LFFFFSFGHATQKVLKLSYLNENARHLGRHEVDPKISHPNLHMHCVYFEPVQVVLGLVNKELSDFDILADRGNLQKISAAIRRSTDYSTFKVFARKHGNLLMLKRSDHDSFSSSAGHDFEQQLCEPSRFVSCHAVISCNAKLPSGKIVHTLIRGEIDACPPNVRRPPPNMYKPHQRTSTDLAVFTLPPGPVRRLELSDLFEIKMAHELGEDDHFQSWLLGVKHIVHGKSARDRKHGHTSEPRYFTDYFLDVMQTLMEFSACIGPSETYCLERHKCGPLMLVKVEDDDDDKAWLNLNYTKAPPAVLEDESSDDTQ